MNMASSEPVDPDAVDFGPSPELLADYDRLVRTAATAVTSDDSLRLIAGEVGKVLIRMAEDPRWDRIFAPAETVAWAMLATRQDLMELPWARYLHVAGYEGPLRRSLWSGNGGCDASIRIGRKGISPAGLHYYAFVAHGSS